MNFEEKTLHRLRVKGPGLVAALGAAGFNGSTPVLVMSARFGGFLRWDETELQDEAGEKLDGSRIAAIYEARAFSEQVELRWWLRHGVPESVRVSESKLKDRSQDWEDCSIRYLRRFDHRYLLWGTTEVSPDGWTSLASRTVGSLAVPVELAPERLVSLGLREYHGLAAGEAGATHGNIVVVEERYLSLQDAGPADTGNDEEARS